MKKPEEIDFMIREVLLPLSRERNKSEEFWKDKRTLVEIVNYFTDSHEIEYDTPPDFKDRDALKEYVTNWAEKQIGPHYKVYSFRAKEGNVCSDMIHLSRLGYFKRVISITIKQQ